MRILFILILLIGQLAFAQKGYQLIDRAEKAYENYQYDKALRLLDKAEGLDYGFCGNAWEVTDRDIATLRFDIYLARERYALARQQLDLLSTMQLNIDSIRMRCYQAELGAYTLRMQLDSAVNNATLVEYEHHKLYALLPLPDSLPALCFKVSYDQELELLWEEDSLAKFRRWRTDFKASQAYQMIINDTLRFYNTQDLSFNYLQLNPNGSYVFEALGSIFYGRYEGQWKMVGKELILNDGQPSAKIRYIYSDEMLTLQSCGKCYEGEYAKELHSAEIIKNYIKRLKNLRTPN